MKILVVVTSHSQLGNTGKVTGYYLPEVSHPVAAFIEAGYEVDFASPQGGKAPMDPNGQSLEDLYNKKFMSDARLAKRLLVS